jgi:hypothetical protein
MTTVMTLKVMGVERREIAGVHPAGVVHRLRVRSSLFQ